MTKQPKLGIAPSKGALITQNEAPLTQNVLKKIRGPHKQEQKPQKCFINRNKHIKERHIKK